MMETFRLIHKWRQAVWQLPAIIVLAGILAFSVNGLRSESLPLIGDWSVDTQMTSVSGERLDISLEEAERLFRNQAAVFIDARSEEDYARGHIRGALNLPWQNIDRFFMEVSANLPPNMPIVTYCDGEMCNFSHDLAVFLLDMGFENVKVLVNGWTVWKNADLPVKEVDAVSS